MDVVGLVRFFLLFLHFGWWDKLIYLEPASWAQFRQCQSGQQCPKHSSQELVLGHTSLHQARRLCWPWPRVLSSIFFIIVSVDGELDEVVVVESASLWRALPRVRGLPLQSQGLVPQKTEWLWISMAVNAFQYQLLNLQRLLWLWFCRGGVWVSGVSFFAFNTIFIKKRSLSPRCFISFTISCPEQNR